MLAALLVALGLSLPAQVNPLTPATQSRLASDRADASELLPSDEELRARAVSDEVVQTAQRLGDGNWEQREAAANRLREESIPLEDLLAILARGGLAPESHHRLVAIATERILTKPVGALGVHMDRDPRGSPGVRITGCVPGMPAERHLKAGDVIVAIDGQAVRTTEDLTNIVQRFAPGTKVRVEVLRAEREGQAAVERRRELTFALGSLRQLESVSVPGQSRVAPSSERQAMAQLVLVRYAPQPIVVEMPEDADTAQRFSQLDPEQHPDVQALTRLLVRFADERRAMDPSTLNMLRATLTDLQKQSNDRNYAEAQRDWFRRVAERYAELLPK